MIRYGVGALAILASSIGIALIVYGAGLIELDILNIPSWIFGPFGAYTLIYGMLSQKDPLYYSVWGTVMLGIAFTSAFYKLINPVIILGVLIIIIVILGLIIRGKVRK